MNTQELKANQGFDEITGEVFELDEARTFQKFGKSGKVGNGKLKNNEGELKFTLWNEDIDLVSVGDIVTFKRGYCTEWQGQLQISTGRDGTLEVKKYGEEEEEEEEEVLEENIDEY